MDGSGNPWIRADLGITGDRIAFVGRLPASAVVSRTIDAGDRVVAPGFVDVHSHAAEGLTTAALRQAQPLIAQGITTIVANPDGGGPIELAQQRARLEDGGTGPNVALLVGHGSIRRAVLGDARRDPTPAELARMVEMVRTAMRAGAFGLSSGLFYAPASFAKTPEVAALANAAAEAGGVYTSHIRDEGNYTVGVVASVDEVIAIAEQSRGVGIVTHMKALGRESWGLSATLLAHIDAARRRGVQVFVDQYPYEASSTSLRAALLPGGVAIPAPLPPAGSDLEQVAADNLARRGGADAIVIAFFPPDRSLEGKRLSEIAGARGGNPVRTALELMAEGNPSIVSFNMSEDDIAAIMRAPYTMASSDGGLVAPGAGHPHPRDYGAFARRLAVYVRERHVVPLEFAIRSMTSLPAMVFGIADRGVIRQGAYADLVVFDPARVRDVATYADPQQLAEGVSDVLVNGVVIRADGRFTEARPGRVLRKNAR